MTSNLNKPHGAKGREGSPCGLDKWCSNNTRLTFDTMKGDRCRVSLRQTGIIAETGLTVAEPTGPKLPPTGSRTAILEMQPPLDS